MKRYFLGIVLAVFLFSGIALAESVGIHIQPSIVNINLDNNYNSQIVMFTLGNPTDNEAVYTLIPEQGLRDYIHLKCDLPNEYWCENKGYTLKNQSMYIKVLFEKKINMNAENLVKYLNIYASPLDVEQGTVGISPSVGIKIIINQKAGSSSGGSSSGGSSSEGSSGGNASAGNTTANETGKPKPPAPDPVDKVPSDYRGINTPTGGVTVVQTDPAMYNLMLGVSIAGMIGLTIYFREEVLDIIGI